MPQVQILPEQKGFGQLLGQGLGQGLSQGIGAGLSQMLEQKKQDAKSRQILSALGIETPSQGKGGASGLAAIGELPSKKSSHLNLSPEKVMAASMVDPELGKVLGTLHQTQQRAEEKLREHEIARSGKYLDKIGAAAEGIPERRIAVNTAKSSIQSGQMTPLGGDWWSEVLRVPGLKTVSGAALSTAAKTNLVGALTQMNGARPNQFMEQQINNAFARAGQTNEANLAQMDIIESVLDLDEKRVELANEIASKYEQEQGFAPGSIDREVQQAMKPFIDKRLKELSYDLQDLTERDMGPEKTAKLNQVPKGTPLTINKAKTLLDKVGGDENKAMKLAISLGYEIPSQEIYSRQR